MNPRDFQNTDTRPVKPVVRPEWETMAYGTYRLVVPGGWLYKSTGYDGQSLAMAFVPDPEQARG